MVWTRIAQYQNFSKSLNAALAIVCTAARVVKEFSLPQRVLVTHAFFSSCEICGLWVCDAVWAFNSLRLDDPDA